METRQGLGRWTTWLLLGMVIINIILYGAAFILSKQSKPTRSIPNTTASPPFSLQEAYSKSYEAASSWQSDVYLVSVTTSWRLTPQDDLTLYRSIWTFSFYSPSAGKAQTITFDPQGAQAGGIRSVDKPPYRAEADWSLNSDDLLSIFLGYGREEFVVDHANVNIHLQLTGKEDGRSIWYMTAIDPVARQSLVVGIDANSREVVLSE